MKKIFLITLTLVLINFPHREAKALLIAPVTTLISVVVSLGCTFKKDTTKCLTGTWKFTGEAFTEGINMTFYAFEEDQYDKGEFGFFGVLGTLFGGFIQLNKSGQQGVFQELSTANVKSLCLEAKKLRREELCLTSPESEEYGENLEIINALQETSSATLSKKIKAITSLDAQSIAQLKLWHHQYNINLFNQAVKEEIITREALTALQKISQLILLRKT